MLSYRKIKIGLLWIKVLIYRLFVIIINIITLFIFIKDWKFAFNFSMLWNIVNIIINFSYEFIFAKTALMILAGGRLIDVALGCNALMLSMSGHERVVAVVFTVISLANIALNAVLITQYGVEGAAIATVTSLFLTKLLLSVYAVKKAGISTTVFGALSFAKTGTA